MNINSGDIFSLEFAGTIVNLMIPQETPIAGETPIGASLTITRIA